MIEVILSTLAEFGLIREDYKHRKRVSKKEKEDGMKRPLQKYLLQPSSIVVIVALGFTTVCAVIFFSYQRLSVYPKKTEKEIEEMTKRMKNWKEKLGEYPTDLNELIGNSPMRQKWKTDSWNRPYHYSVTEDGNGFSIVSAGSDGKFKTEDDIKSE